MGFWNDVKNDWRTTFTNKAKREEFFIILITFFVANYIHVEWFSYDSFWKDCLILFALVIVTEIALAAAWNMIKRIKNR